VVKDIIISHLSYYLGKTRFS